MGNLSLSGFKRIMLQIFRRNSSERKKPVTPDVLTRISLILFLSGSSCVVISWWLYSKVRAEANLKLLDEEKFGMFWAYPGKAASVKALHKSFYPTSKLRLPLTVFVYAGTFCGIGVMYLLLVYDISPISVDLLR